MAMTAGGAGELNSEPNVTPMIDVLLVLLIIFMVVIALGRTALQVNIPPPDTETMQQQQSDQIVLELRDDGTDWINGTQVPGDGLSQRIHEIFDPRPDKLLFIKPGMNVKYSAVIASIDVVMGSGIEVVGFTPVEAN